MSHWYFKVVCACDATMTGEMDKDPKGIVGIFLEVHRGPEHWAEIRTSENRVAESMVELRKLAKVSRREAVAAASL